MKTLQQITQKTKNYNPKKAISKTKKNNGLTGGFEQGNFLWQAYLSTREGTFAEGLKSIPLVTFRRYAENGCYRARLVLEKFERFVQTCKMQIGQELFSPQTKTENTNMNQTSSNPTQKETPTAPSYDQCRLSAYAAYSMKMRLLAEKRAANHAQNNAEGLLAQAA